MNPSESIKSINAIIFAFNIGMYQVKYVYQNPFKGILAKNYRRGHIQGRLDRIQRLMRNIRYNQAMAKIEWK